MLYQGPLSLGWFNWISDISLSFWAIIARSFPSSNGGLKGHGPLTRYYKLRVAHAPGMPGTFSPLPRVSDLDMHHGTCVTHVPWCMPGSSTCGFLWRRWRGKRSWHSPRMRNPQFCISGKRPMAVITGRFTWMWFLIHALLLLREYAPDMWLPFTFIHLNCIGVLRGHITRTCNDLHSLLKQT